MGIIITHGRDQAFEIPATLERAWPDALRFGLARAGMADPDAVDIGFAFYGDIWRPDGRADDERGAAPEAETAIRSAMRQPPSELEVAIASELLPGDAAGLERGGWDSLAAVVRRLDEAFGVGQIALAWFLKDLDLYFRDPEVRGRAMAAVGDACRARPGPTLLLAHSMGSIVAYDVLATHGAHALGVTGLVSFGSPLGLPTIRRHLDWFHPGTPYPDQLVTWTNVYNRRDFATVVREIADVYPARDGRRIVDVEVLGGDPGSLEPEPAHDPVVYLSSIALAEAVRRLVEPAGRGPLPEPRAESEPTSELAPGAGASPQARSRSSGPGRSIWERVRGTPDRGPTRSLPRSSAPGAPPSGQPRAAGPVGGGEPPPTEAATAERPAEETAAAELAGTRVIERTASANFPPVVQPGSTHELLFAISGAAIHAQSTPLAPIEVPEDQKTMALRVGVYAADFDVSAVEDPTRTWARVTVDLVNPEAVAEGRFRLTAHPVRERRETPIYLTFYRGNLPVGQLAVLSAIDPRHQVGLASISMPIGGAPDPDYVLVVTDQSPNVKGAGPFDISVSKEGEFLNLPLGSFPVSVDAWEYASQRLDGFRQIQDETSPEERIRAAQLLGIQLWNDLPDGFRRFYWEELHGREGASIAVYSQEPYLPWELIKPQREPGGEEDGFLGAVFNMARWKQALRFPDPLAVTRFSVIAPEYGPDSGHQPLPGAQAEAEALGDEFGAEPIPGTRARVRQLLESTEGVQLIHFAGHGEYTKDSADLGSIWLADAPLVPGDLTQAKIGRSSRPFVFLNACEVGERGWALTRIGGWAEAFTDVGFSGFVGPYWAVNDRVALKAAMLFYRSLSAGLSVAEAVRQIRLKFYTDEGDPGHPSWLAYTLHCQPNIRIQMLGGARPTAMATEGGR